MSSKLVCGIGFNDGKYPTKVNGKNTKEYDLWRSLLCRCYAFSTHKIRPTYVGCSASKEFKNFTYFHEWCQSQIGFGREGYHLDKDLLVRGNRVYSEDTCTFLPSELNTLLLSCKRVRGVLPVGVSPWKDKFRASCRRGSAAYYLGVFKTPEEAFQAYKEAKEAFIKSQAEEWKALIDPRAYAALMAYEVLATD